MLFVALILVFTIILYFYNRKIFRYWKVRGIHYEKPVLLLGTYKNMYLARQSRSQIIEELYWKYPKEKVVGGFKTTTPELVIRDPELIKTVLISDFTSFYSRGVNYSNDEEPLSNHLFAIDGDPWRMLRHRMTPAFTSGKLKAMFPLIVERTEKLQSSTLVAAADGRPLDARELMARYTTDFIGACGFGVDSDSLNDENSAFRRLGRNMFNITYRDIVVALLKDLFPKWSKNLKTFAKVESEVLGLVKQIQKERNFKPSGRNDFMDLMLDFWNKPIEADSIEHVNDDGSPVKVSMILDDELLAAQIFVFFGAGFETSASSTSITLHALAYNPEVQKKVQKHIDQVLTRHNNKLSYEAVKEMTYLEWTFHEGLRILPSLGYLMRRSTKKYAFKDINLNIDERVNIVIPVQALHMDPKYWENPEEFRPERFHPDNFGPTQKMVYFPFGEGPRNCIGARLGLMQSMAGLAAILAKFTVEPAPESRRYPMVEPKSNIVQSIRGGLPLMFRERDGISI